MNIVKHILLLVTKPPRFHLDSDTSLDISAVLNSVVTPSVEDELRGQIDTLTQKVAALTEALTGMLCSVKGCLSM